jgi:hypothetical protein
MWRCRHSSHSHLRSSSCSLFHARACLTPSPFGRGEQNSKHFGGLVSSPLAIWGKGCGSVDSELSEHSGDIRQGRRGSDRSRNKGWGNDGEWLEGCEVNDRDGSLDMNRGVDGELVRKQDRGVSNGSCRILVGEVIVAVRGHVREGVLVEVLRTSGKWGMRRLSVTITRGKTLDSVVMTTRAEKYH